MHPNTNHGQEYVSVDLQKSLVSIISRLVTYSQSQAPTSCWGGRAVNKSHNKIIISSYIIHGNIQQYFHSHYTSLMFSGSTEIFSCRKLFNSTTFTFIFPKYNSKSRYNYSSSKFVCICNPRLVCI